MECEPISEKVQSSIQRPLSPIEMLNYLDLYVEGHEEVKRALVSAVYSHYLGLAYRAYTREQGAERDMGRHHIMLVGPSGSGKTYMIKLLAKYLNVPFLRINAAGLTRSGYVGENLPDVFRRLVKRHTESGAVSRAIVYLDEVDKLAGNGSKWEGFSSTAIQQEILLALDGEELSFTSTRYQASDEGSIDTSNLLFIASGAFVGIDKIVNSRTKQMGFGEPEGSLQTSVTEEDLIEFGLIPEFIGRFSTIAKLDPLSRESLRRILCEVENSVIARHKEFFEIHGIELQFDEDAIEAILDRVIELETGARALHSTVAEILKSVTWQAHQLHKIHTGAIRITKAVVTKGELPLIKSREGNTHGDALVTVLVSGLKGVKLPGKDENVAEVKKEVSSKGRPEWLGFDRASPSAQKFWQSFESTQKPGVVSKVLKELELRKATLTEFFLTYVASDTDNIAGVILLFDYRRLLNKKEFMEHLRTLTIKKTVQDYQKWLLQQPEISIEIQKHKDEQWKGKEAEDFEKLIIKKYPFGTHRKKDHLELLPPDLRNMCAT